LRKAIGTRSDGLAEYERGYWGNMTMMASSPQVTPPPHPPGVNRVLATVGR